MIEFKNISKTFGDVKALDNISGVVKEGMIFGLLGSNGAGKSTLIRLLSGVMKTDDGEIFIDGLPVYDNPEAKSKLCFLSDTAYFFPNSTPVIMRDYYALIYPEFNKEEFDNLLNKIGLDANRKIHTFSKGMKKQLSVLLGFCTGTKYLLCDETFDGLDPVIRQTVKSLFCSALTKRDFTVIIASHNLRELEDICDNIGLLHHGRFLLSEELDTAKANICKIQCVLGDTDKEEQLIRELSPSNIQRTGALITMTVKDQNEKAKQLLKDLNPVYYEILPLSLEEIFIAETEVTGYDIKNILS